MEYSAQNGDTLPALAAHFNTTIQEILEANPDLSAKITTLTPGSRLLIPIYYKALWGNPFQILPDAYFANGPLQSSFDTKAFVDSHPAGEKLFRSWLVMKPAAAET